MSRPAITVENLSKAYRLGLRDDRPDSLIGAAQQLALAPFKNFRRLSRLNTFKHQGDTDDTFWALRNVSFEIAEGEVVGIIGRNGAGKSTLLKILSRITEPTSGRAIIHGRVSSLLEVGTGFHQELSGRENVYMNGTILGMTKREIDRKFDEIVAFSGVEKFLDTPIKHYSSGMKVRLAFSVAAHLEPEILIIDEVLAVGDAEFQKKCLGKMEDVAAGGRTVLFVSHNMAAVRSLTSTSIYLESGAVVESGSTDDVIESYLSRSIEAALNSHRSSLDYFRRSMNPSSPVHFRRVWLDTDEMQSNQLIEVESGKNLRIGFEIESALELSEACLSLSLIRNHEDCVVTLFSPDTGHRLPIVKGSQRVICEISDLPLAPGKYSINCGVNQSATSLAFDVLLDFPIFQVHIPKVANGEIDWPHRPWGAVHWNHVRWQQC